jgi:hypothetical protein
MTEDTDAGVSPALVAQTVAFLAVVLLLPTAFALGGRLRYLALAAVGVLLLVGFLVLGVRQARDSGTLAAHATFLVVWLGGAAAADRLATRAAGRLPEPVPFLVGVGVGLGALWLGARLAYGERSARDLFGFGGTAEE